MKKILALVLMTLSASAFAWHNGYRGYNNYNYNYNNNYNNNWVGPALAGVVVGGLVARQYYAPPPVVYIQPQQPVMYYQQPYPANNGYHQENILDANCNCYRTVLVPN